MAPTLDEYREQKKDPYFLTDVVCPVCRKTFRKAEADLCPACRTIVFDRDTDGRAVLLSTETPDDAPSFDVTIMPFKVKSKAKPGEVVPLDLERYMMMDGRTDVYIAGRPIFANALIMPPHDVEIGIVYSSEPMQMQTDNAPGFFGLTGTMRQPAPPKREEPGEKTGFCPECGTKRTASQKFCMECGYKLPPLS
ncbi:MAG: zinc-ribbon domain-containing protein [Clostridia bacterium]|nr:zinc-ribbon domain-containing protein [Clostridia bacterium]